MHNVTTVARNDVIDLVRSNIIWVAIGLTTILVLGNWAADPDVVRSASEPFLLVVLQFDLWLPLFAIIFGYNAVVGECESGRVRILLGQPIRRRDIVLGKFLARAFVLLSMISIAIALLLVLTLVQTSGFDPLEVVAGTFGVFLYGLAWLGATIGVSAIVSYGKQVIGVMLIVYAVLVVLWTPFTAKVLALAVSGTDDISDLIDLSEPIVTYAGGEMWFLYAFRLGPSEAFSGSVFYSYELLRAGISGEALTIGHGPNLFGLAELFGWTIAPVLIGAWLFDRGDL